MQWNMTEGNDFSMEFLEDLSNYNESMDNAYDLVTKRKTLDDIYLELDSGEYTEFYLPFDPSTNDGRDEATLDLLIEHFSGIEAYEKCDELLKLKNKCLRIQTDSDRQL